MTSAIEKAKETLSQRIGQRTEPTDWFEITQDRVNQFAEATLDHQWIHVDPERAKSGPFGGPIAHGQLTMSVMSFLPGGQGVGLPSLEGMKMGINYADKWAANMAKKPPSSDKKAQAVNFILDILNKDGIKKFTQAQVEKLIESQLGSDDKLLPGK